MNRSRLRARWQSVAPAVDWAMALALTAAGLADLAALRFTDPLWTGALVTLVLFLPLGARRRAPFAVLVCVVGASLVLQLVLQDPGGSQQYGFEVFLAWLLVSYSTAAHTDGRWHRVGIAVALLGGLIWGVISIAAGAVADNVYPALFFCGIAWFAGRSARRWRALVRDLDERTRELEQERENRAHAAVADERGRIARELHDVVAHNVSVMVVQAQAGTRLLADTELAGGAFRSIESSGQEALVELRRMLGILRTEEGQVLVAPQPGLASLDALVEQVREAGLPIEIRVEGERARLPPGIDLSAYRIVQEALTNTLRHAGPARATVLIRYGQSTLELEVDDDGVGPAANGERAGHGLIGMRERVALYGGSLEAGRRSHGGYRVRARLPLGGMSR